MTSRTIYRVQALLGLVYLAAGAAKLLGADIMVQEFDMIGVGQEFRILAGIVEIAGGLCLFVPRFAIFGVVLLACVTVGAVGAIIGHVATTATQSPPPNAPQLTISKYYQV